MGLKLSELIIAHGDDTIGVQPLDQCAERMNMSNGITKITFGTDQPLGLEGTEKMGLVVWLDRKKVAEIIAASKAGA